VVSCISRGGEGGGCYGYGVIDVARALVKTENYIKRATSVAAALMTTFRRAAVIRPPRPSPSINNYCYYSVVAVNAGTASAGDIILILLLYVYMCRWYIRQ